MPIISPQVIEEIKDRVDIIEYLGAYMTIKRAGSSYTACCPFHNEKTPSFHINPIQRRYHCFGCNEDGDVIKFVMKQDGLTFVEAIEKLAKFANITLEEKKLDFKAKARAKLLQIHVGLADFYQRCLAQTKEASKARDYLASRDLDDEIVQRFKIGYAPDSQSALIKWGQKYNFSIQDLQQTGILKPPYHPGGSPYDLFHGRLVFPICDKNGRPIAFSCRDLTGEAKSKYINSPETDLFKKSDTLYAFHLAKQVILKSTPREALICEGQIDVIRCHAAGFQNAIASQGTAFTPNHVTMLKKVADSAILVFDSDSAGQKAALRTTKLFLAENIPVKIATLPPGEDPDSLIRTKGPDAFRECLAKAQSPATYQGAILKAAEANPTALDAIKRISRELVSTIAPCTDPILIAAFLKEAAEIVALPISAFEQTLEDVKAQAQADAQRRESYAQQPAQSTKETTQETTQKDPPAIIHYDDGDRPDDDGEEVIDDWDGDIGTPVDQSKVIDRPVDRDRPIDYDQTDTETDTKDPIQSSYKAMLITDNLSEAFCELLAHYFHDPDVMELLLAHLPQCFVSQPYATKLYTLACDAYIKRTDYLDAPQDDQTFCAFLQKIFSKNSRVEYAKEVTPVDLAKDLIKKFWLLECKTHRETLSPDDTIGRLTLTASINRFTTLPWENAKSYMNAQAADKLPTIATPKPVAKKQKQKSLADFETMVYTESDDIPDDMSEPDDQTLYDESIF